MQSACSLSSPLASDSFVVPDEHGDVVGVAQAFAAPPTGSTLLLSPSPSSGFDPSLWTIARMGHEVVGFVLARVRGREGRSEGYVSQIGVRTRWRGKRLGHTLLRYVLWRLRSRGLQTASLDGDATNVTDALRLYRGVGMTEHPAFTIWEADLAEESEL